jgi:hypothetical protein
MAVRPSRPVSRWVLNAVTLCTPLCVAAAILAPHEPSDAYYKSGAFLFSIWVIKLAFQHPPAPK